MRLGINQLALLRRCYYRGKLGLKDASYYYNLKLNRKNFERLKAILEKLEIMGFFIQINNDKWVLTESGNAFVKDYFDLKEKMNRRGLNK